MYSEQLLDHFRNPRNAGALDAPSVTIAVENPACGDEMRLSVRLDGGRAEEVRYQVRGCTAAIAAGSALTELAKGRTPNEIKKIDAAAIEEALGGLPATSRHAAVLCLDAIRALTEEIARRPSDQQPK